MTAREEGSGKGGKKRTWGWVDLLWEKGKKKPFFGG